jgi:hypothetical protein
MTRKRKRLILLSALALAAALLGYYRHQASHELTFQNRSIDYWFTYTIFLSKHCRS